jgi:hypothetical protein
MCSPFPSYRDIDKDYAIQRRKIEACADSESIQRRREQEIQPPHFGKAAFRRDWVRSPILQKIDSLSDTAA